MTPDLHSLLLPTLSAADGAAQSIPASRLVPAALLGIAVIVVLITRFKIHPFLGLTLGSLTVGAVAGVAMGDTVDSFTKGFGSTAAGVGTLIALGAMFGKLLADSGGADEIVDTLVGRSSERTLPWAMAAVGAIIGLPMFFEIGLVLLMPVIFLVARRARSRWSASASPPSPASRRCTGWCRRTPARSWPSTPSRPTSASPSMLGVLVAIPTIAVAGPLFAKFAGRWVDVPAPEMFVTGDDDEREGRSRRPAFARRCSPSSSPSSS